MNVPSLSRKFNALSLGVALCLVSGAGFAQQAATPQATGPSAQLPQAQLPQAQLPQAVAQPSASNQLSPNAVNALQQNIGQQVQAPAAAPAAVASSGSPPLVLPEGANESTLLREVARYQAQLSLLNLFAKIEKSRLDIERERIKFEQEKEEARTKSAPVLPAGAPATGTSLGGTAGASSGTASASVPQFEEPKPSVRSIYSFDGKTFADVVIDGTKVVATPGAVLFNGDRVVSISPSMVVLSRKGRQMKLPVESGSSGGVMSGATGPVSAPSAAPSSLPPIPPGRH